MITIEPSLGFTLSTSALTRFLNRARPAIGLGGEIDVLLSNDQTLRHLNKTFRGKNKTTDVLSFPAPALAAKHAGYCKRSVFPGNGLLWWQDLSAC
jgi:probable rRNA maturation factor